MSEPEATTVRRNSLKRHKEENLTHKGSHLGPNDTRECDYKSFPFYNCVIYAQKSRWVVNKHTGKILNKNKLYVVSKPHVEHGSDIILCSVSLFLHERRVTQSTYSSDWHFYSRRLMTQAENTPWFKSVLEFKWKVRRCWIWCVLRTGETHDT